MKIQYLLGFLLVGTCLLLAMSSPIQADSPPETQPPSPILDEPTVPPDGAAADYPFHPKEVVNRSAAITSSAIGNRIDVAVTDAYDEQNPAVALCASDQYLVVYERGGQIYGQRLANDGALLGSAFLISNSSSYSKANPDVACDWILNRFIVVWDYDYYGDNSDYDIHARGVYGGHQTSGSQLYGSELPVSEDASGIDERDPAIACNSDDHTCLVTFEYSGSGSGDIYGQRVAVGTSSISNEGSRFSIGGFGVKEYNPDITWGGRENNFLVVWQYWENNNNYLILFSEVWDTNQAGSQIDRGGTYLDTPPVGDKNELSPAVAYNRDARDYLVVYQYDYSGDGSDYDIRGTRLDATDTHIYTHIVVSETYDHEVSPAIAFSGGPQNISGGMGANQFLVTFIRTGSEKSVYSQAIKGDVNQLDGAPEQLRYTGNSINFGLFSPDVTGSINNGRYMVVWSDMIGGFAGTDYDILGQMVASGTTVYLPFIIRN